MQHRYWAELCQLKTHINYIELMLAQSEKIEQAIKITLAIASSASIGAWAIFKNEEYKWIWPSIIAISQIITAINPYLPFKGRVKAYSNILNEFEEIMIFAELNWHNVANGKLTEEEINKLQFDIKSKKQKILKKYMPSSTIPKNTEYFTKAESSAIQYFQNFYPT
ncbi:MAG: hypothetical protein Q8L15_02305 [Methylobacter sp.]|nr:hypothetical protein [Methylobacter sp.]